MSVCLSAKTIPVCVLLILSSGGRPSIHRFSNATMPFFNLFKK